MKTRSGSTDTEGAGLYLHIPFCSRICPYCDFAVRTGTRERRDRFVDLLVRELELYAGEPPRFDTVYLGGGTPSLLSAAALEHILESVWRFFTLASTVRIFLEANPEDVSQERISAWRGLNVDTVSVGAQSFDPAVLLFLGRRHGPDEARHAVELCCQGGFDTVSVDLMYGLPDQPLSQWEADLSAAVALGPQHLSCYQLTVHEGTPFGRRKSRGELLELSDAAQAKLFSFTHRYLAAHGYLGYEVSNFALSAEHRSSHNLKYWRQQPYWGFGPSAHSFDGRRRWWNARSLSSWEDRVTRGERPVEGGEVLGARELALETLMLGLRTVEGVDLDAFRDRFGVDLLAVNRHRVERYRAQGLVSLDHRRLRPTLAGLAVADGLAAALETEPSGIPAPQVSRPEP